LRKSRQQARAEIEARLSEKGMTLDDLRLKPDGTRSYRPRALSPRQYRFVEEYLACGNATEAARRAGYSVRKNSNPATRLLRTLAIRRQIRARYADAALTPDEILGRMAEIASAHYDDFVVVDPDTGETRVDLAAAKAAGKLHLIKRIRQTKSGNEVEFYSRLVALSQLAKMRGMFRETNEPDWRAEFREHGINAEMFDEYLVSEVAQLMDALKDNSADSADSDLKPIRMLGPGG
jgi:phage terminase small subunit